jgi:hypothetical protein
MIKSRKMKCAWHVAHMRKRGMQIGFWWESQKERDHWEEIDADGRIVLKWILYVWTGFFWPRRGTSDGLL